MITKEEIKAKSILTKEEWREYTKTVWQIANTSPRLLDHPSVFPEEIPHRLIKLFTFWGDTVLDPFGGVGTTAKAGIPVGRKVVCVDQNPAYVDLIRSECGQLRNGTAGPPTTQAVRRGQPRSIFPARWVCWPCGHEPALLEQSRLWQGTEKRWQRPKLPSLLFDEIRPVFKECYRVLQPGRKLCIVTAHVNQHTNHGLLTFLRYRSHHDLRILASCW